MASSEDLVMIKEIAAKTVEEWEDKMGSQGWKTEKDEVKNNYYFLFF